MLFPDFWVMNPKNYLQLLFIQLVFPFSNDFSIE